MVWADLRIRMRRASEVLSYLWHHYALTVCLVVLVGFSGFSVAYVSYENRQLHNRIQTALNDRNAAQVEWGKLLLEHSTLTAPLRIEMLAKTQLDMVVPDSKQIEVVQP